ncbi:molybdenum ABC transporter ATP-binding protein ModC [Vibrio coralliilyticus]|uniref:molybdenum ABC transporter ATP-binding protein ModC n=1 Tax=Vibrio coralliilyticus TaxID=190893 RepID=UPI00240944F2|nr:molybdenum ABC transporter ATP-binding protein ModC [Vibrio coralliilyticus]WFB50130.1 molybdenum ABC transporter ATP-binding protein ModC [Vibrio coralliilyticus]
MSDIRIQFKQTLGEQKFDIDVSMPEKGITAIFGRSGAGKTSLIDVVAGLRTPDQGEITVSGKTLYSSQSKINVSAHKRRVGYVFQESRLFPHYRVKGNLLYGVRELDQQHFDKVIKLLALEPLLKRYPIQLSGGEKQRVAIGRALLSKPEILLMDEPLASLDIPRKREVLPFLEQLASEIEIPIIYVSHSLNEVVRLANHIVVIDDGKVVTSGNLEDVWSSRAMRPWQSFSDQSSLFEGTVVHHNTNYALSKVKLADNVCIWVQRLEIAPEAKVRLQVRASDVSIALDKSKKSSIRNILKAKIAQIQSHSQGTNRQSVSVKLELSENCYLWATITAWAKDELELQEGMEVFAQIKGVSVTQRDVVLSH